jgi:hypothetical protein
MAERTPSIDKNMKAWLVTIQKMGAFWAQRIHPRRIGKIQALTLIASFYSTVFFHEIAIDYN